MSDMENTPEMFHCCKCQESGEYDDLQHAYENGWYCNDDAYYCSEHAGAAIEEEDKAWDDAKVKKSKFIPTVSGMEFYQYQMWQRGVFQSKPEWFMTDDAKANDIMSHYREVEQYYN